MHGSRACSEVVRRKAEELAEHLCFWARVGLHGANTLLVRLALQVLVEVPVSCVAEITHLPRPWGVLVELTLLLSLGLLAPLYSIDEIVRRLAWHLDVNHHLVRLVPAASVVANLAPDPSLSRRISLGALWAGPCLPQFLGHHCGLLDLLAPMDDWSLDAS